MSIPRETDEKVQEILKNKDMPNWRKAQLIYAYDYDMSGRETNGRMPKLKTEAEIKEELDRRG